MDLGTRRDLGRAADHGERMDGDVRLDLDRRLDPRRLRVDDRHAREHVRVVNPAPKARGGVRDVDPGGDNVRPSIRRDVRRDLLASPARIAIICRQCSSPGTFCGRMR
jgi:hypothetical protein